MPPITTASAVSAATIRTPRRRGRDAAPGSSWGSVLMVMGSLAPECVDGCQSCGTGGWVDTETDADGDCGGDGAEPCGDREDHPRPGELGKEDRAEDADGDAEQAA